MGFPPPTWMACQFLAMRPALQETDSREVFHLLFLGFFDATPLSWRVLEEHYRGTLFQKRFSPFASFVDHSSLSERLEKMPVEFFEQLFQYSFSLLEK